MTTNSNSQTFVDAIAQLQKDQRFLEKKKSLSASDKRKPKMSMMDYHYLQIIPSLVYMFERILEDIEDGDGAFETDYMIAEAVNLMNQHGVNSENNNHG